MCIVQQTQRKSSDPAGGKVEFCLMKFFRPLGLRVDQMSQSFELRNLELSDYDKGYMTLLAQLTDVGDVTKQMFQDKFYKISPNKTILVLEDKSTNKVIASASLLIEHKFTNKCGTHGHIEDVVVNEAYRGFGLGKLLIDELVKISIHKNNHRTILDCQQHNVKFYEKCGFHIRGFEMAMYHNKPYKKSKL